MGDDTSLEEAGWLRNAEALTGHLARSMRERKERGERNWKEGILIAKLDKLGEEYVNAKSDHVRNGVIRRARGTIREMLGRLRVREYMKIFRARAAAYERYKEGKVQPTKPHGVTPHYLT
jgi:hypothetical protein